jgi:branched-chain amino acid transport system permease protein
MNFNPEFFIQLVLNGLLLGAFYATTALGFSIIWGVMRLINLAHGEFLMMGAFVAWFFFNPTRAQNLTFAVADPNTFEFGETTFTFHVTTLAAMSVFAIIIAAIISEDILKTRYPNALLRRSGAVIGAIIVASIVFFIWRSNEFVPFSIPMMFMIMVGLALSIGFMISFMVLYITLNWGTIWERRIIGYFIGGLVTALFYMGWKETNLIPIDPFVSLPLIFVLFFALGFVVQGGFFNRLIGSPYLAMLLITFAVSIALQNFGLTIYRADPRRINVDYGTAFRLTDSILISPIRVLIVIVSAFMIIGLVLFLNRTRTGYAIRAAAQNDMAARLMGINIREVYAITFAISLALTGMAGAMMATFQPITPVDGPAWTLRAFAIVALGGLGKVEGVVVGGLVLGVAESLVGGYINTGWAVAVAFILLVVMLVVRPQGITGGLVTEEA